MSFLASSGNKARLRAEIGLYFFLLLLFLAYRSFYWRNDLPDQWVQVIVNSLFDVLLIFGLQTLYRQFIHGQRINRFLVFGLWLGFAIVGSFILRYLHYLGHLWTGGLEGRFAKTFSMISFQVFDSYIVVMIGFCLGTAFHLLLNWNEAQLRITELEKDKALAEINYLRSQINPHFVFNTLNSIFFLIKPDNEPARDALHTFSGMLRYQLYESNQDLVPIEEEVRYLQNYMYLQKIRQEDNVDIQFHLAPQIVGFSIAPMLLIVPIENAFKHLSHWDEKLNTVEVRLHVHDEIFSCEVFNTREDEGGRELGGIGLGNLKRRLELLYSDRHDLQIVEHPESYQLTLSLML